MHILTVANPQCAAGIYVEALGAARINFEVIDPTTWTYIALNSVTVSSGGYQPIAVGPFYPPPYDVYVRFRCSEPAA